MKNLIKKSLFIITSLLCIAPTSIQAMSILEECQKTGKNAETEVQLIFQKAIKKLGFKEKDEPKIIFFESVLRTPSGVIASAGPNKIMVDMQMFQYTDRNQYVITAFHELTHIKHNDYEISDNLELKAPLVYAAACLIGKSGHFLHTTDSTRLSAIPFTLSKTLGLRHELSETFASFNTKFIEFRADYVAHDLLACERCITDSSKIQALHNFHGHQMFVKGYITEKECLRLAQKYKGQYCDQHFYSVDGRIGNKLFWI